MPWWPRFQTCPTCGIRDYFDDVCPNCAKRAAEQPRERWMPVEKALNSVRSAVPRKLNL